MLDTQSPLTQWEAHDGSIILKNVGQRCVEEVKDDSLAFANERKDEEKALEHIYTIASRNKVIKELRSCKADTRAKGSQGLLRVIHDQIMNASTNTAEKLPINDYNHEPGVL